MNLKRTTTIAVGCGALIAWLAGAATSNHAIQSVTVIEPTAIEKRGAELAIEIERLHERLAPAVAPSAPGRNLFTFRALAAARPVTPIAEGPRAAASEAAPAPLAVPPLKLAGIAED
jgi:hypothetical protein